MLWLQNESNRDFARFTTHVGICLATNKVAKLFFEDGKTRNIAIQLVLQRSRKLNKLHVFFLPVLPHLKNRIDQGQNEKLSTGVVKFSPFRSHVTLCFLWWYITFYLAFFKSRSKSLGDIYNAYQEEEAVPASASVVQRAMPVLSSNKPPVPAPRNDVEIRRTSVDYPPTEPAPPLPGAPPNHIFKPGKFGNITQLQVTSIGHWTMSDQYLLMFDEILPSVGQDDQTYSRWSKIVLR